LVITGVVMWYRRDPKKPLVKLPIIRDIIFYALAVVALAYVFFEGEVSLLSGIILVGLYVAYVVLVYYWKRIFKYEDVESNPVTEESGNKVHRWVPGFLLKLDHSFSKNQFVVFLASIGIISLLSWLLVDSAIGISATLRIPELLVGITIVAIGTSVPDLISSVIVAKQGRHGMAINNAIGSNIFDILIGLGLPFLLYGLIHGSGFKLAKDDLIFSVSILLASAALLLVFFKWNNFRTSRPAGIILVGLYIVYLGHIIATSI